MGCSGAQHERKGRNRMGNAAKVMLIDDDESLHVLMRRIVEDAGYAF